MINIFKNYTFVIFYALLLAALTQIDWGGMSLPGVLVTLVVASIIADFASGLWHLFVDYYPLNYPLGYDQILFYKGKRDSEEFTQLRQSIIDRGSFMDRLAYQFKAHHKYPKCSRSINRNFLDTAIGAFAALAYAVFLLFVYRLDNPSGILLLTLLHAYPEYILGVLIFAALVANIEHIHHCVHYPKEFPIAGRVIGFLQRCGLVYASQTHTRHHRGDGVGFCFITGHANFAIGYLRKFLLGRGIITEDRWHGRP